MDVMISFTLSRLYPSGTRRRHLLSRILDGSQSGCRRGGEKRKIRAPTLSPST